jgi:tetrahydromethanopterin S-methyltransferase subunit G
MITIDTLRYVKRLTAVGVSREQAEAQAEAFRDEIAVQVATKSDLDTVAAKLDHKIDAVEGRLLQKIDALDHKVDAVEGRLNQKIDALDHKVDAVEGRLNQKIDAVEGRVDLKFAALEARLLMLNWMCGFTLAAVMAVLWKSLK